jgi:hypothetical protein
MVRSCPTVTTLCENDGGGTAGYEQKSAAQEQHKIEAIRFFADNRADSVTT